MNFKTKKEIIEFWEMEHQNSQMLWALEAGIIATIIRKNTTSSAVKALKKNYKKYKDMACSSSDLQAIQQLKSLKK